MVSWGRRRGRGRVDKEDRGSPSGGGGGPAVRGGFPTCAHKAGATSCTGKGGTHGRTDTGVRVSAPYGRFVAPSARVDAEAGRLSGAPGQQSGAGAGASAVGQLLRHLLGPSGSKRSSTRITTPLQPRHRGARLGRVPHRPQQAETTTGGPAGDPGPTERAGMWRQAPHIRKSASGQARSPEWTAPPANQELRGRGASSSNPTSRLQPRQRPPSLASAQPASNRGHLVGWFKASSFWMKLEVDIPLNFQSHKRCDPQEVIKLSTDSSEDGALGLHPLHTPDPVPCTPAGLPWAHPHSMALGRARARISSQADPSLSRILGEFPVNIFLSKGPSCPGVRECPLGEEQGPQRASHWGPKGTHGAPRCSAPGRK